MAAPNRIQKTVDDVALTGGKLLGGAKAAVDDTVAGVRRYSKTHTLGQAIQQGADAVAKVAPPLAEKGWKYLERGAYDPSVFAMSGVNALHGTMMAPVDAVVRANAAIQQARKVEASKAPEAEKRKAWRAAAVVLGASGIDLATMGPGKGGKAALEAAAKAGVEIAAEDAAKLGVKGAAVAKKGAAVSAPQAPSVPAVGEVAGAPRAPAVGEFKAPGAGEAAPGPQMVGYHGSPKTDLSSVRTSERGALGPGAYFTPSEGVAARYAGPEGKTYAADLSGVFDGMHWPRNSSVNPYQVWRDQVAKLVEADPKRAEEIGAIAAKMQPQDGYPFFKRIAAMYGSEQDAQDLFRKAGFTGVAGHADGPEIAMFDEVPLPGAAKPEPDLDNILSDAEARGVKLSVQQGNQGLRLSRIEVPKEDRSKGLGTEIMEKLANYADATGQRISLTPSSDFGGSVPRLKTFYGRHGFTPNTGKSRDLSISDTMIREPVVITPETDGQ